MDTADLVVINTCAIREARRAEGDRPAGAPEAPEGREPRHAGRADRAARSASPSATGSAAASRRSTSSCGPTRSPSSSTGSGWPRPRAPVGLPAIASAATTIVGRATVGAADHLPGTRAAAVAGGAVAPRVGDQRLAADHLRLRQDLHLLHRPVQPRPGAQPAVRRDRRRGPDAWPPPATARSRCSARTSTRTATTCAPEPRFADVDTERWAGRRLDLHGRPDLAALIRAIDGIRTADGVPAIPRLRFVTSHPWDLQRPPDRGDGRLPVDLRAPPPAGPVGRRRGPPPDGPPVHDRALPRAARPDPARRCPGIAISTDVIVGFCGETDAQFQSTLAPARDRPLRPGLRGRLLGAARDAGDPPRRRRAAGREAGAA